MMPPRNVPLTNWNVGGGCSVHLLLILLPVVLLVSTTIATTQTTMYHHHLARDFNCDMVFNPATEESGPNFRNIRPASNALESMATGPNREYNILSHYAQSLLPLNSSRDDFMNCRSRFVLPTNPFLDSRLVVVQITRKHISRILLGCSNNTEMDQIFLDPTTRPFALYGSSSFRDICIRDGDYDFAVIDMVQLLYVAQQHPDAIRRQCTIISLIRCCPFRVPSS